MRIDAFGRAVKARAFRPRAADLGTRTTVNRSPTPGNGADNRIRLFTTTDGGAAGQRVDGATAPSSSGDTTRSRIGGSQDKAPCPMGRIGELRIHDRARSSTELASPAAASASPDSPAASATAQ